MPRPEAPVDRLTYYPLPFVPQNNLPPVPKPGDFSYDPEIADFHHPVFERSQIEGLGAGGAAARDSRIQWVWRHHHILLHKEWGGLSEHLPDTPVKQYRMVVFGVAGYVPEQGIDFSRRTPRVVTMRLEQREHLRDSGQLMVGNGGARIRRFLLEYSLQSGSQAVNPNLVDEFLELASTHHRPERVHALTNILLQQTIEPIVTPGIKQVYEHIKKRGMFRPGVPSALGSLIKNEILTGFTRDGFSRFFAAKLSALRAAPIMH